jgi:hypothetical protein
LRLFRQFTAALKVIFQSTLHKACSDITAKNLINETVIVMPESPQSNSLHISQNKKKRLTRPFGGKPPKAWEPLLWTNQQPTNDQPTNQLTAEELKYSHTRSRRHQRLTNNLLEVWQNLAPFGGRPIGAAVEALLTKVVNRQLSVSPIAVFL